MQADQGHLLVESSGAGERGAHVELSEFEVEVGASRPNRGLRQNRWLG
jgi:hypothetical protein